MSKPLHYGNEPVMFIRTDDHDVRAALLQHLPYNREPFLASVGYGCQDEPLSVQVWYSGSEHGVGSQDLHISRSIFLHSTCWSGFQGSEVHEQAPSFHQGCNLLNDLLSNVDWYGNDYHVTFSHFRMQIMSEPYTQPCSYLCLSALAPDTDIKTSFFEEGAEPLSHFTGTTHNEHFQVLSAPITASFITSTGGFTPVHILKASAP